MKKIYAFYGLIICIVADLFLFPMSFHFSIKDFSENFLYLFLFALFFGTGGVLPFYIHKIEFNLEAQYAEATYVVNWRNNYDLNTNWELHIDEIESAEVVYLTRQEKKQYTCTKFLFNKYIKINHKYGHCKYLYVFWFSNRQIKKIIKLLTNNK